MNTNLIDLAAAPAVDMRRKLFKMNDVQLRHVLTLAYLGQLEQERRAAPSPGEILARLIEADLPTLQKFISDLRLAIWSDDFARRAASR